MTEFFQHALLIVQIDKPRLLKFFRGLAGLIFCLTIIAAGYNLAKPIWESQDNYEWTQARIQVLTVSVQDNNRDLEILGRSQKVNRSLAMRSRRVASAKLATLLETPPEETGSTVEIWVLFILKLVIQTSALCFSWLIGHTYRKNGSLGKLPIPLTDRSVKRYWNVLNSKLHDFIGIVEYTDGGFHSILPDRSKKYKTIIGAQIPFKTTTFKLSAVPVVVAK